ncbi:MAG: nucleotidyltransferase substrate binding protein [Oligoflexia bacterium]|nr:nucleotidyltransferase substrate binding protein [Oligoflexia bacterium]
MLTKMNSTFSLTPLRNSLKSLESILAQPINEYLRDGVIKRFEYTFELSRKTIKRFFKNIGREDILDGPKPIIREAGKNNLISNVEAWLNFHEARNISTEVEFVVLIKNILILISLSFVKTSTNSHSLNYEMILRNQILLLQLIL